MEVGQTVYTVNNVTNKVDSWTYSGVLPTANGKLIQLDKDNKTCWLPRKCVFETELEAKIIAGSYH